MDAQQAATAKEALDILQHLNACKTWVMDNIYAPISEFLGVENFEKTQHTGKMIALGGIVLLAYAFLPVIFQSIGLILSIAKLMTTLAFTVGFSFLSPSIILGGLLTVGGLALLGYGVSQKNATLIEDYKSVNTGSINNAFILTSMYRSARELLCKTEAPAEYTSLASTSVHAQIFMYVDMGVSNIAETMLNGFVPMKNNIMSMFADDSGHNAIAPTDPIQFNQVVHNGVFFTKNALSGVSGLCNFDPEKVGSVVSGLFSKPSR